MKIRPARLADVSIITAFNSRLDWETEGRRLKPPVLRRGVRAVLTDRTKGTYFVAELAGVVVGQLLITREWSDWRNGDFWWLQSVYVARAHRRRGVFRALFAHVARLARRRARVCGLRLYMEQHNHRARNTYTRLGLRKTRYQMFAAEFTAKSKLAPAPARARLRA